MALLLLVLAPRPGQAAPDDLEAGPAPAGCWTMAGGCAARTGATHTPGIGGPLAAAWTRELGEDGGVIEEEPRVWHDRVFVTLREGARRRLCVVGLADGRPLAEPLVFETDQPLELSVWNETLVIRSAAAELSAYRLRGGQLERVWQATTTGRFHSPMLFDDRVYALDGGDVVSWALSSASPVWRLKGSHRGRLAIRGQDLYTLLVDDLGNTFLLPIQRLTGRAQGKVFAGAFATEGRVSEGDRCDIAALHDNVFIRYRSPLKSGSGKRLHTSWILRMAVGSGSGVHRKNGLMDYTRLPVEAGKGWLVTYPDEKTGHELSHMWNHDKDASRSTGAVLAQGRRHQPYHRSSLPYTVAGDIAYAGGRAFELASKRIVWDSGSDPRIRPVPAHETLLVVPQGRRLTALRQEGAVGASAMFFGPAVGVGSATPPAPQRTEGVVFFVDEAIHGGAYELAGDGQSVKTFTKRGKREKTKTHAIHRVTFALDAEGGLVYTSTPAGLDRALSRYHFLRRKGDFFKLAKDAYKTYDPKLMERLILEAVARGVTDKQLKFSRQKLAGLIRRPRKKDEKRIAKLLAKEQGFLKEDHQISLRALESPLDDPRWPVQQAFIRRMLAGGRSHPKATALVKARLPSFIPPPEQFRALEWIDFVDQLQGTTARRLKRPTPGAKDLTRIDREYGAALATWRKDLVALEAEELLILTPLAKPGRIAGCLSMGTLVCDALEDVFKAGANVRNNPWPLILRLYESKKEYLAASTRPGAKGPGRMEWTSGHYSPSDGLSRIFLPERSDAWRDVMSTYAHELTHHWIAERCPLFKSGDYKRLAGAPGYWIVEGMATFVEEFHWDLESRTWNTTNPGAESLDVVANASPQQLHPWRSLYNFDQRAFWRLKRNDKKREVPMRWRLGYHHVLSEARMFYMQAAATCHYLHHAGEKERKALLEYVRQHYTGKMPPKQESIRNVFGISPEELGTRVVAYAKKMNAAR